MNDIQLQALAFAYGISEETLKGICASLEHSGWHPPEPIKTTESTVILKNQKPLLIKEATEKIDLAPFELICKLGEGGMGVVYRVRDKNLNRTLALKCLRPDLVEIDQSITRFIEEAQFTSQLQHPGIIPVHSYGQLDNGLHYFTMREVQGRTFSHMINELYAPQNKLLSNQSLHRLIEIFKQACSAVAYAHSNGVIHCDLKPSNIMVGSFGEVYVLDWGVAQKVFLQSSKSNVSIKIPNSNLNSTFTPMMGTPQYMAPEQASGLISQLSLQTDVFSLGLILFQIITGKIAYGSDPVDALRRSKEDEREPLDGPLPIPDLLQEIYKKATNIEPSQRYTNAGELVFELTEWLDGAQKEAKAQSLVLRASQLLPTAQDLQSQSAQLFAQSQKELEDISKAAPEQQKWSGWETEEKAEALQLQAQQKEIEYTNLLHGALSHFPDHMDAHSLLAQYYEREHQKSELNKDRSRTQRMEGMLLFHTNSLPEQSPNRVRHLNYLKGDGAITITTEIPDVDVEIYRYEEKHRKLEAVFYTHLGTTPIYEYPIPCGSYLIQLKKSGYRTVNYPVHITRLSHWDTIPPQKDMPLAIKMFRSHELKADEIYVPDGWFWTISDLDEKKKIWLDGFVIKQFPVTNREYLTFLNELIHEGREKEALYHAPQDQQGINKREVQIYGRNSHGLFYLKPDLEGDLWDADWPVLMVGWPNALAYAQYYAQPEKPWRLPFELEWEKAARGTDGRKYPWGDFFDPSRCCNRYSTEQRLLPASIYDFPADQSPYFVRGFAGNCSEWCLDPYNIHPQQYLESNVPTKSEERMIRGGSWIHQPSALNLKRRISNVPHTRLSNLGFRLAFRVPNQI